MKTKILTIVAALMLFGISQAQASTVEYSGGGGSGVPLPLNGKIGFSGPNSLLLPAIFYVSQYVKVTGADYNPYCDVGFCVTDDFAQLWFITSISHYNQAGDFIEINQAGPIFSNCWHISCDSLAYRGIYGDADHFAFNVSDWSDYFVISTQNDPDGKLRVLDARLFVELPDGVSITPLPAALPLFATGLGALGLLGWRRKRKAKAAA